LYYYPNPYVVNPYYQPAETRSVPVNYVPTPYSYDAYQQHWDLNVPRHYPQVDTGQLEDSVTRFQKLIKEADLLINRLANSKEFSTQLMSAAQKSDKNKVIQLIREAGVSIHVTTTFTPTGIRIILDNSEVEGGCCDLMIALRW
jgi:hypothetical protein